MYFYLRFINIFIVQYVKKKVPLPELMDKLHKLD